MNQTLHLPLLLVATLNAMVAAADESPFPVTCDWGQIITTANTVELHVTSAPDDQLVRVPRFNNPYKRIHLKSDPKKKPLTFRPEVSEWLITLPKSATTPSTIVIETVGPPQLLTKPFITKAGSNGEFLLPAHHAIVHGKLLRYEPQPHKNTVGYWADEKDWCEWQIEAQEPGKYEVHILQGCGKDHGGSEVQISIGKSELTFAVEDTGHFQKFKDRNVGTLTITKAGRQSLKVVPVSKAKAAVMDVRQIRLVRADR